MTEYQQIADADYFPPDMELLSLDESNYQEVFKHGMSQEKLDIANVAGYEGNFISSEIIALDEELISVPSDYTGTAAELSAKIYGDVQKTKWNYYKHGNKYEIYSPLKQNRKHIEYMKSFLKAFGDVPCFSIITMICSDFKISGEINRNNHIDSAICSSLPMMKEAIRRIAEDNPTVFDDAKKQEIFEYIKSNQYSGKQARQEHKQRVIAYKESIEEYNKRKICPYCKVELVLRNGKNGKFYGCSNFPKCKYTTNCED